MRVMRAHDFPCGTVRAYLAYTTPRIKSPQLYRLSYQPKLLEACGYSSPLRRAARAIVPAMYPGAIGFVGVFA
jgi:hypothetical protein